MLPCSFWIVPVSTKCECLFFPIYNSTSWIVRLKNRFSRVIIRELVSVSKNAVNVWLFHVNKYKGIKARTTDRVIVWAVFVCGRITARTITQSIVSVILTKSLDSSAGRRLYIATCLVNLTLGIITEKKKKSRAFNNKCYNF